jgi:DNA-binding response OmpR family regulator
MSAGRNRVNIAPMPSTELSGPCPKMLVLEQDGPLREAMRMLLNAEGYCVLPAASLSAALSLARDEPGIEVLLVEDPLPDGTVGSQAIASLRKVIGTQLKALLLTQHLSSSLRELEHDGRVRLATSPIGADDLIAKLQALRRSGH